MSRSRGNSEIKSDSHVAAGQLILSRHICSLSNHLEWYGHKLGFIHLREGFKRPQGACNLDKITPRHPSNQAFRSKVLDLVVWRSLKKSFQMAGVLGISICLSVSEDFPGSNMLLCASRIPMCVCHLCSPCSVPFHSLLPRPSCQSSSRLIGAAMVYRRPRRACFVSGLMSKPLKY